MCHVAGGGGRDAPGVSCILTTCLSVKLQRLCVRRNDCLEPHVVHVDGSVMRPATACHKPVISLTDRWYLWAILVVWRRIYT